MHSTLIGLSQRCGVCHVEFEYQKPSLRHRYCGYECARRWAERPPQTPNETRRALSAAQRELAVLEELLGQAHPADVNEVRWIIRELAKLPGVGGTGDYDTPESIVARLRDALTEANNRAMAWEKKKAKAGR